MSEGKTPLRRTPGNPLLLRDKLGVCQWFHFEDDAALGRAVEWLRDLGIRHVRTGVSWADFHRPGGRAWYARQMAALREFEVLLSVWHTPPSLSVDGTCNAPPRVPKDYADFLDLLIDLHGDDFAALELWNEPNNLYKWNFRRHDPEWRTFAKMIAMAANWARHRGKRTVLGGMIPVDPAWLRLVEGHGALDAIDVVAIHGFPGLWGEDRPNWDWHRDWRGWDERVERIAAVAGGRTVWVTETGFATWDHDRGVPGHEEQQVERLESALAAPAERVYWYSLVDLDPARPAIEGFHVDENEYHLGLVTADGRPKPAFHRLREWLDRAGVGSH